MAQKPLPYIGLTGFTRQTDVQQVLEYYNGMNRHGIPHHIMVGILASSKTLDGKTPKKYPERYPTREQLPNMFICHPRVINLVHLHSSDDNRLLKDMTAVHNLGTFVFEDPTQLCGFQLNMTWPAPQILRAYRDEWDLPNKKHIIVLQVGPKAMEEARYDDDRICERIQAYRNLIDYVLLDYSGGEGTKFDWMTPNGLIHRLKKRGDHQVGIGIAGGLGPDDLKAVEQLGTIHPCLCIDAETGLMGRDGTMDATKAKLYALRAHNIFGKNMYSAL